MGGAFHHMQLPAEGDTQFRCFGLAEMEVIIAPLHAVHALASASGVSRKGFSLEISFPPISIITGRVKARARSLSERGTFLIP